MIITKVFRSILLCLAVSVITNANAQTNLCLFDDTSFTTPTDVQGVAIADFNKDGKQDIATVTGDGEKLSVRMGNGNGTFGTATDYTVTLGFMDIVTEDFNGDGNIDLALCQSDVPSKAVIMLGSATGAFSAPAFFDAGNISFSITTGDFNNDNKADLAMPNYLDDSMSVLLGNGSGGFGTATNYSTGSGSNPVGIASADLNGDGKEDIVTVNLALRDVAVFLSTGTSFAAGVHYIVSDTADVFGINLGDYNKDGKIDLCVATIYSDSLSVLAGVGNGTFGTVVRYSCGAGTSPVAVITADINTDGQTDLVTANVGAGNITVLLGAGNGTFSQPYMFPAGGECIAVAAGDLNGDGYNDIAVGNGDNTAKCSIILNALPSLKTTVTNATITAEQAGAYYLWINCNTKTPIPGATQKSFTPTVSGNYAVIIDRNGCGDTSACKQVTVGIQDVNSKYFPLKIFPNPVGNTLNVDVSATGSLSYKLYHFTGALVAQGVLGSSRSIDVSALVPGIYALQVEGDALKAVTRFTKL